MKSVLGIHLDAAGIGAVILLVANLAQGAFELVLEEVAHGDDLDVLRAAHHIDDGLRSAPSAAHQTGLEQFLAGAANQFGFNDGECGNGWKEGAAGYSIHLADSILYANDGGIDNPAQATSLHHMAASAR